MHLQRVGTAVLCTLWLSVGPGLARADTYSIPPDYRVACLDLETGRKLWEAAPGPLYRPYLGIIDGKLLATDIHSAPRSLMDPMIPAQRSPGLRYLLDPGDGRTLLTLPAQEPIKVDQTQLPPARNLTDSRGRVFEYDDGNTRDLQTAGQGRDRFVLKLEAWIHDLTVVGDLAIFNFADESGEGGGEVYAYDLRRRALAWELDASRSLPGLPDHIYTAVAADRAQVYVSVDQTILALDLATGKQVWMTRLPRQTIRRYDSAWTTFGRHQDKLFVQVYEDLFLLDAATGRLIWALDAGPFANPWPLVHDGKVYVSTRQGPVQQMSASFVSGGEREVVSALKITRAGDAYRITPMSRRAIPAGEAVWWSLKPPPAGKRGPRVVLRLAAGEGSDRLELDLTTALARQPEVYVKFHGWFRSAALTRGRRTLATSAW